MMTSTEWSPADHMVGNSTAPDLFGGELFGDELIDMYNADAVVGTNGDIPHLLPLVDHDSCDVNHQGEHMVLSSSSFDDGLGAFRPCTSFSDLTSLLPEATQPVVSSCDMMMTVAPVSNVDTNGHKRSADSHLSEPPQKKKTTSKPRAPAQGRRVPAKTTNASTSPTSPGHAAPKFKKEQIALSEHQAGHVANNTPNPLSSVPRAPESAKDVNVSTLPSSAAPPIVVSPRPASICKGDKIVSEGSAQPPGAAVPSSPLSGSGSEADFKSVAQAAVTNLILNVGAMKPDEVKSFTSEDKVDTSTAHIKALTSSNWVAACTGEAVDDNDDASISAADSKASRARRQNLTPDERARQNRDRNREHARNTRLRKKAYVEELKRTLTELVAQRDAVELEKRHTAQRELEQREVRFRVMEEFLKIRGRNESSYGRWGAILEDSFSLTLPVTDYRKMVEKETSNLEPRTEQVLLGATEAMEDATHLASFLQTLGSGMEDSSGKAPVTLSYHCDRKFFHMDGCNAVIMWTAITVGAIAEGAPMELSLKGNMRAEFSPASNKLISAEIMFDTGNVAAQLQLLDSPKGELNDELDNCCDMAASAAAAQAAANEADALLDSLQMPQLGSNVPTAINFVSSSSLEGDMSGANTVSDKDDSSDEGFGDMMSNQFGSESLSAEAAMATRRSSRRKD